MKHIIFLISLIYCLAGNAFTTSRQGKQMIKEFETLKLDVYTIGGHKTIGYGHQLLKSENYKHISEAKANKLFEADIKIAENGVNNLLKNVQCTITQGMYDALVSLVYNSGEQGVRNTTFYKKLCLCRKHNQKDLDYACSFIKTTNVSMPGHKVRRLKEYKRTLCS